MENQFIPLPGLDFQALENTHRQQHSNAWITIAVAPIEDAGHYGTVEFDTVGHVTAFREKIECRCGLNNAPSSNTYSSLIRSAF